MQLSCACWLPSQRRLTGAYFISALGVQEGAAIFCMLAPKHAGARRCGRSGAAILCILAPEYAGFINFKPAPKLALRPGVSPVRRWSTKWAVQAHSLDGETASGRTTALDSRLSHRCDRGGRPGCDRVGVGVDEVPAPFAERGSSTKSLARALVCRRAVHCKRLTISDTGLDAL